MECFASRDWVRRAFSRAGRAGLGATFALYCALILTSALTLTMSGCASTGATQTAAADPLPSWNDSAPKHAIEKFVADVTHDGSPNYVPPEQRIAVFDNDGTLWSEQPMPVQLVFLLDQVKAQAPNHPEWKSNPAYKALVDHDASALAAHQKQLLQLIALANSGMTTDEYDQTVRDWLASARDPKTHRPYTELVYQPQLELLAYLRANGFKTYIVSGGTIEFMRPWTEKVYGIPPEQVIGSSQVVKYEMRDGKPVLLRMPKLDFVNDGAGKPVGIYRNIGRRPILAFGNSDGDLQMLEYTAGGSGESLELLVHHDDAAREFAYDRDSRMAKLDKAWDEALAHGWTVVSMKSDWNTVYPAAKQ